jgi:uncharacterized protein YndB with AHSA1/START domain
MPTDNTRSLSVRRVIAAPAAKIFDVLADPARHGDIDGSSMVRAPAKSAPKRLSMGARFRMDMRIGPMPYKISNKVVEFEADRRIAWRHLGGHTWRYELVPVDATHTEVIETFDWSTARVPKAIELVGYPARHEVGMTKTLERLAAVVE